MVYLMMVVDFLYKFIAPFLVPIALIFARKVTDLQLHNEQIMIPRYKLPEFLGWMETKDEMCPGDIHIQIVGDMYRRCGWFITSWYWLGVRNTGSLMWQFGKEAPNYLSAMTEEEKKLFGVYQKIRKFWFIKIISGWAIYRDWYSAKTNDGFWAVPYFSVRFL